MSTVQLAFDQRLERYVAIKLLAEHLADDPTFVSRFRREALSAARLVHPNIVQVFDFGFDEQAHQHFIVMEHVPGHSCAELLRDHGPMEVAQGVDVITQACRGLDYAHRNGVVHRDVKPGNLLVSDSDVVKLADFGIARATDQSSITQVGSVLGTAAYLAPEQARGEEAGPRADLYSLGVVAYQLLTGRLPYEANSLSELALKQQRDPPPSVDELNPRVPPELADAISMALSLDKEDRPETAMLLAEEISAGARGVEPQSNGARTRNRRWHRDHPRAVGASSHRPDPRRAPHRRADEPDGRPRAPAPPARTAPSRLSPADGRLRTRRLGPSRAGRAAAPVARRAPLLRLPGRGRAVRGGGGGGDHDRRQRVEQRRPLPQGRRPRHAATRSSSFRASSVSTRNSSGGAPSGDARRHLDSLGHFPGAGRLVRVRQRVAARSAQRGIYWPTGSGVEAPGGTRTCASS